MQTSHTAFPPPHSAEELEFLVSLGHNISDFSSMELAEQDVLLKQLESFECHAQVVKLLEWRIQHGSAGDSNVFADSLWLLRIYYLGLEDFQGFLECANRCVHRLKLPFSMIRIHIAEEILGAENFREHALLYEGLLETLSDKSQKVLALERLALIYEKKLFVETAVEPIFRRILELDRHNVKSLRFFKLWYVQGGQWQEAAEQLERLIEAAANPFERQRTAHELAQLYLYNLNQPQQARDILVEYCQDYPLDTFQTLIEALERLGAFDEVLASLDKAFLQTGEESERAAIRLKQGLVCLKIDRALEAIRYLRESIALNSTNLLAHEALVSALIDARLHHELYDTMAALAQSVLLPQSQRNIAAFLKRAKPVHEELCALQKLG